MSEVKQTRNTELFDIYHSYDPAVHLSISALARKYDITEARVRQILAAEKLRREKEGPIHE